MVSTSELFKHAQKDGYIDDPRQPYEWRLILAFLQIINTHWHERPAEPDMATLTAAQVVELTFNHHVKPITENEIMQKLEPANPEEVTDSSSPYRREVEQLYQEVAAMIPGGEVLMQHRYQERLREVWQTLYGSQGSFRDFLNFFLDGATIDDHSHGVYIRDPFKHDHQRLPDPEKLREAHYSRLYPIFNRQEMDTLNQKTVAVFGCSTASITVKLLRQLGVGKIIVIDPDLIASSNTTRMLLSGELDVGSSKALSTARDAMWNDPESQIEVYPASLDIGSIIHILSGTDLVIEAIDNAPRKLDIRLLLTKIAELKAAADPQDKIALIAVPQYLIMPTNNNSVPQITAEEPGDPPFQRDLTLDKLHQLFAKKGQEAFVDAVINIVGINNIPPRQMVGFILLFYGKINYIPQHGVSAALAGSWAVETISHLLLGAKLANKEQSIDMTTMLDRASLDAKDDEYLGELQANYPDIFLPGYVSLSEALIDLVPQVFKNQPYNYYQ